jgi:hypothetical protein
VQSPPPAAAAAAAADKSSKQKQKGGKQQGQKQQQQDKNTSSAQEIRALRIEKVCYTTTLTAIGTLLLEVCLPVLQETAMKDMQVSNIVWHFHNWVHMLDCCAHDARDPVSTHMHPPVCL